MKYAILKSIGAILAGMIVGTILSVVTDTILETTGIMKITPFDENPVWLIALVTIYKTVFNSVGTFITAKLAPSKPMKHAIILGVIGVIATTVGTIVMWHIPPHWFPISLIVLTMPAAWLGGKFAIKNQLSKK